MQAELLPMLQKTGKLTIEQAIRWFRDSFRTENNILMELTLDDWGWLKSHRTKDGLFSAAHDEQETKRYLARVDGLRSDLDIRIIINFLKQFTVWRRTGIHSLQKHLRRTLI